MRTLFVVAAAISLTALPAFAQTDAPSPAPAPEKKICRSIVPTGSIMGKRICHTKAEWTEFNRLNQENTDGALDRRRSDGKAAELD